MALPVETLHPNPTFTERHPALKEVIQKDQFPESIGIIPDGNRRWAIMKGLEPWEGHLEGLQNIIRIIKEYSDSPTKRLFLWGASIDNLTKRTPEEVEHLNEYIAMGLIQYGQELIDDNARLIHVGDKKLLGNNLTSVIDDLETKSSGNNGQTVYLALAYGGADHERRSRLRLAEFVAHTVRTNPNIDIKSYLTDEVLDSFADGDGNWRNMDLLIRTTTPKASWDLSEPELQTFHLSGIGEVVGTRTIVATIPQYFPDLTFGDFDSAVLAFAKSDRRQGK